jgi:phosphate transport system permease protein
MSFGLVLLVLLVMSTATYALARRKAVSAARGARLNSLPGFYGGYVALWTGLPALVLLVVLTLAGDRLPGRDYLPLLALVLAVSGALWAYSRIRPTFQARTRVDGWVRGVLMACSGVAILTTLGIVGSLLYESLRFFDIVPPLSFLFGTQWSPRSRSAPTKRDRRAPSGLSRCSWAPFW